MLYVVFHVVFVRTEDHNAEVDIDAGFEGPAEVRDVRQPAPCML
jgi:hypothetical protein